MRVGDQYRMPLASGDGQGALEFVLHGVTGLYMIQKHVAFDRRDLPCMCGCQCDSVGCGAAVKKEHAASGNRLHQAIHRQTVLRQEAA